MIYFTSDEEWIKSKIKSKIGLMLLFWKQFAAGMMLVQL